MTLESLGYDDGFARSFAELTCSLSLTQEFRPARVIRPDRGLCLVNDGEAEWLAEPLGRTRHDEDFVPPSVGDWVVIQARPGSARAALVAVLPRRSHFSRKVNLSATQEQVIAANIDCLMIVVALDVDFNLRRIERYLTSVEAGGVEPVIVLSKADLAYDPEGVLGQVREVAPTVRTLATSSRTGSGFDAMSAFLEPRATYAFVGSSGVGKSSIVNRLLGEPRQVTSAVRERDQRGQHTTTRRELVALPGGALLIDTPGLRELRLWAEEGQVEEAFTDIQGLSHGCRFRDCRHQGEPGCAVDAAVASGVLEVGRVASYQKQLREIAALERRRAQLEKQRERAARRVRPEPSARRKPKADWDD